MSTQLRLATFRVDVTPPIGHPLCGGWLDPAIAIADPLHAHGLVLAGCGDPVVLCVIDWCEICNRSHIAWRTALAEAAGTTPDRVAMHTMHPHCTPWDDQEAQRIVEQQPGVGHMMDPAWCAGAARRVAEAARDAVRHWRPFTHLGLGRSQVEMVASNRRIIGADGKVRAMRLTRCPDPAIRAEPVGLIDPWLKTISFWDGQQKLAALHYYAVHDTSYDNDRTITCDFTGLARDRRMADEPGVFHAYFTECAGNIGAGKYNDGSAENRPVLADRVYRAIVRSEQDAARVPVDAYEWATVAATFPPRPDLTDQQLDGIVHSPSARGRDRIQAAMQIAYRRRLAEPILLTRLSFGESVHILGLPGESFIEYQLLAQSLRPSSWLAAASYADCGPGYICLERSYDEGGYEPTDSFVSPACESILRRSIAHLLPPETRA